VARWTGYLRHLTGYSVYCVVDTSLLGASAALSRADAKSFQGGFSHPRRLGQLMLWRRLGRKRRLAGTVAEELVTVTDLISDSTQ
jgi:hypothetical protein